ncbi:hypothetical protein [Izhakiella australiensis]|nr:hypothetical protein [Izhakiella australiensis]
MTDKTELERQAFEELCDRYGYNTKREHNPFDESQWWYESDLVHSMWHGWQARANLEKNDG